MSKEIINFIKAAYDERKKNNPLYSIRAFAKNLNIDHSALTRILSKKRTISFEKANTILTALKVQDSIKNSLLLTLADANNYQKEVEREKFENLSEAQIKAAHKWYYHAFLSSLEISRVSHTIESIANFLSISKEEAQEAASFFLNLNFIQQDDDKKITLNTKYLSSFIKEDRNALRLVQESIMEKSLEHLAKEKSTLDESYYTATVLAVPKHKIPEAVRRIREFKRSLSSWLYEDNLEKTDVYLFNTQLHPLNCK